MTDARPTMREIARRAGVSVMTVSRALRRDASVARGTHRRVRRIARELGYRADPEVSRLMIHLRRRSKSRFQGLISAVTDASTKLDHPYIRALIEGVRERAESRSYAFGFLHLEDDEAHRRGLRRTLWARGARGVVLLPFERSFHVDTLLAWKELPVVAATSSVLSPDLHRVMPSHYANTLLLCSKLAQLGYRRIGLVLEGDHDRRTAQVFSAAVILHEFQAHGSFIPPLIYEEFDSARLQAWFRASRPDAIIARDDELGLRYAEALGLKVGGPVAIAGVSVPANSGWAGIDELPGEVGASAVDRLIAMIEQGERDLPRMPTVTLVRGRWRDGPSVAASL